MRIDNNNRHMVTFFYFRAHTPQACCDEISQAIVGINQGSLSSEAVGRRPIFMYTDKHYC